jgi:hypothetical protein
MQSPCEREAVWPTVLVIMANEMLQNARTCGDSAKADVDRCCELAASEDNPCSFLYLGRKAATHTQELARTSPNIKQYVRRAPQHTSY